MSIRLKLMLLMALMGGAMVLSFIAQAIISRPITVIEEEQKELDSLGEAALVFANEINRIDSEEFITQGEKIRIAKENLNQAFLRVQAGEALAALTGTIEAALEILTVYQEEINTAYESFLRRAGEMEKITARVSGTTGPFTLLDQLTRQGEMNDTTGGELRQAVTALYSSAYVVDVTTWRTIENLRIQRTMVAGEIVKLKGRVRTIISALIGGILLVSLTIGLVIVLRIGWRIKRIETGIQKMKAGDLADRIILTSRDELGRLSRDVNEFTEELGCSMGRIKKASENNVSVKEELVKGVANLSRMVSEVDGGAERISGDMIQLGETIGTADETVLTVERHVMRLKEALDDQLATMETSTAAVTEMIASINNVGVITKKKRRAMDDLSLNAAESLKRMQVTSEIIRKIHSSIDEIHEAVDMIKSIAARTNMLAMNAAIEAAHAGDAGKGFAVVADEIRKLAETSAQNSQKIDMVIGGIVKDIEEASESGSTTHEAVTVIAGEVDQVTAAFEEIARNMEEVQSGGQQILGSLAQLNQVSQRVTESSQAMENAVEENRRASGEVSRLSRLVGDRVSSIAESSKLMEASLSEVTRETERIDSLTQVLEAEVKIYKTGVEEAGDLAVLEDINTPEA